MVYLVFLAAIAPQDAAVAPKPYPVASHQAVREGRPLVVFVGQPPRRLLGPGFEVEPVVARDDDIVVGPCVLIHVPNEKGGLDRKDIGGVVTDAEIAQVIWILTNHRDARTGRQAVYTAPASWQRLDRHTLGRVAGPVRSGWCPSGK